MVVCCFHGAKVGRCLTVLVAIVRPIWVPTHGHDLVSLLQLFRGWLRSARETQNHQVALAALHLRHQPSLLLPRPSPRTVAAVAAVAGHVPREVARRILGGAHPGLPPASEEALCLRPRSRPLGCCMGCMGCMHRRATCARRLAFAATRWGAGRAARAGALGGLKCGVALLLCFCLKVVPIRLWTPAFFGASLLIFREAGKGGRLRKAPLGLWKRPLCRPLSCPPLGMFQLHPTGSVRRGIAPLLLRWFRGFRPRCGLGGLRGVWMRGAAVPGVFRRILAVLLPSGSTPVVAGGVIVWRAGGPAGGRGFGSLLAGLSQAICIRQLQMQVLTQGLSLFGPQFDIVELSLQHCLHDRLTHQESFFKNTCLKYEALHQGCHRVSGGVQA
mmetsp:Transcript_86328/g.176211  ORF Transcript_86328/g.176211 Transcript_86328/m.176211 type:complete len:386 (+) Transcript_86328:136-1293(+)